MTSEQFESVYTLCRKARPVRTESLGADRDSAVNLFNNVKLEAAREVVERWTRDSGYLSALRDLNMI